MPDQHFDYLDGWRGLAIIFLLIGHFYPVPGINFGTVGVNLFFVLSGLLMTRLLFIKAVPIPLFYQRRIARIFPAFFVMLAIVTVVFIFSGNTVNWSEVAMAALFLNNYFPAEMGQAVMPFGHIWSLSVEEHAYILLSLIAFTSRRQCHPPPSLYTLAFFTIASALTGVWYWTQFSGKELDFGWWLHTEVSAYGILVSGFFVLFFQNRKIPQLPWIVYPACVLLGIALHWWSVPNPVRTIFGIGLFALAVNLLAEAPPIIKCMLSMRLLKKMGLWSFSIYLWQQPFYLAHHRQGLPSWLMLSFALACGIASFYLIEQPVRNYLNNRRTGAGDKSTGDAKQ